MLLNLKLNENMKKYCSEHFLRDVMMDVIRENNLMKKYLECRASMIWKETMGDMIFSYTRKVEFKGNTLYIILNSPIAKNELRMYTDEILEKIQSKIGRDYLKNIEIK